MALRVYDNERDLHNSHPERSSLLPITSLKDVVGTIGNRRSLI